MGLARPSLAPPDPPMLEDVPHDDDGNEPLYANMAAVSQNSDAENHPENDGAATSDNSYMSNEVDGKEKLGGRLSKFLRLRPKISTSYIVKEVIKVTQEKDCKPLMYLYSM